MTLKTAATRYARALMDVALKEQADLSRIESELAGFAALLKDYPELGKIFLNPAVPAANKRGVVEALIAQAGTQPIVSKLLLLLADRDRLVLVPELVDAYRQRLMDHQKVVQAEVTTTEPLAADRAEAIANSLARATGRTVRLLTRVDPSIIGGLVARIGGTVYDGSVTSQLQRLKQRLDDSV